MGIPFLCARVPYGIFGSGLDRELMGLPPFPQTTRKGWGTEAYSKNALKDAG